jgi:hypothetical protein
MCAKGYVKKLKRRVSKFVMILALGLRPMHKHGKVQAMSATQEPHLYSHECEGMNPHTPKWTPTLGVRSFTESQIFKEVFQGLKFIKLNNSLYH